MIKGISQQHIILIPVHMVDTYVSVITSFLAYILQGGSGCLTQGIRNLPLQVFSAWITLVPVRAERTDISSRFMYLVMLFRALASYFISGRCDPS